MTCTTIITEEHQTGILSRVPAKCRVWGVLICGTALYFFANIQRVAIPGSVFNVLQQELQVSAPYITALGASFMYIYALCQLAIGLLVDRYGGNRVIAVGALLFCIGSVLFPLSHNLVMLYTCRAIVGLGASTLYLSLVREIMRTFDKNFTIMLAIMILIGYTGGIVANAPFVICTNLIGWRSVMLLVATVCGGFYVLFLILKSSLDMPPLEPVHFSYKPFLKILRKRHNRHLFLFVGINFGLYYVLQTVLGKKFLEDFCQIAPDNAAFVLSLMGTISAVSGLSFAIISRMLGNRRRALLRTVGITCISVFLLITVLVALEVRTVWLAVLFCLLASTASTSAIAVPLLRETNDSEAIGVSVSILNFSCYMAVAVFGNAVGVLMNLYAPEQHGDLLIYTPASYLAVFGTMLALSVIVTWCSFHLRETMGENVADTTH